jgi:hypothetical protein
MGDTSFYGPGLTVDTSKVFTVVTQFIGDPLTEIKRYYVQGGKYVESLSLNFSLSPASAILRENSFSIHEADFVLF